MTNSRKMSTLGQQLYYYLNKNMMHSNAECTIYVNKVLISYFTGIASMRAW